MYRLDIQDYATGFAETEAFDDFTLLEAKLTDKVMICCNAIRLPRNLWEKAKWYSLPVGVGSANNKIKPISSVRTDRGFFIA